MPAETSPPHLLLVGGGHAHLFVLERLARQPQRAHRVVLVSPSRWQYYSGMLPGWLAGMYRLDACRLDLAALCERAGVTFIEQPALALDTRARRLHFGDGGTLDYRLVSLDVGSETDLDWVADEQPLVLSIKPLERFQAGWKQVLQRLEAQRTGRLAVVGGGAAGVELAMAIARAVARAGLRVETVLLAGQQGPLKGHARGARRRIRRELARCGVKLLQTRGGIREGRLFAGEEALVVDAVIAASGARAPGWLAESGLALDEDGFVLVDEYHRSRSHPEVFAVGDVCARPGTALGRSGVYSVRAGPVLAHNLLATLERQPLRPYHPRRRSLYLISCGDRRALALWGRFSLAADRFLQWKDWIDRRFIARFKDR